MASVTAIPGQYAKFITAVLGETVAYIQLCGTTWHLDAALVMAGAALAVLGVPNATAPVAPAPPVAPSVSMTPPAADRPPAGSL